MEKLSKIYIALCEGQHDIAFLSRVLFVHGFTEYKKKIREFITPFDKQFLTELSKKPIESRTIGYQSQYMVPSVVLVKNNAFVFFHNLGGDGRIKERNKVLRMYTNLTDSAEDDFTSGLGVDYRFLFFFDADDIGVSDRVEELKVELGYEDLEHCKIVKNGETEFGCYIFHKDDSEKGTLEDLLISLMQIDNNEIFEKGKNYLLQNHLEEERQKEFKCDHNEQSYSGTSKFKEKKSIISLAGQLQFSGMNNSVIIAKSDYITREKLMQNTQCVEIQSLFS